MRVADILGFALSALRQQKMRAVLTTLGVVFGTLVLAAVVFLLATRWGIGTSSDSAHYLRSARHLLGREEILVTIDAPSTAAQARISAAETVASRGSGSMLNRSLL